MQGNCGDGRGFILISSVCQPRAKVCWGSCLVECAGFSSVCVQAGSAAAGMWEESEKSSAVFFLTKRPQSFDFSPKHQQTLIWVTWIHSGHWTTKINHLFILALLDAVRSGGPGVAVFCFFFSSYSLVTNGWTVWWTMLQLCTTQQMFSLGYLQFKEPVQGTSAHGCFCFCRRW